MLYRGGLSRSLRGHQFLACGLMAFFVLCRSPVWSQTSDAEGLTVVCSTTQIADFTRQVAGDRWRVISILTPRADPHLYEPTVDDARRVTQATLCLSNGWHLEGKEWMKTLAQDAGKPVVECVTGVRPLQIDAATTASDPHAWFDPRRAAQYVRNIVGALSQYDAKHEAEYRARAELYLQQLATLDRWIERQVSTIPSGRRVLVTSHDAFRYFCDRYQFTSAAPLSWSTEELGGGLTPARRKATIDAIRSAGVPVIFVETSIPQRRIEQIARDAGVSLGGELYSDSMGGVGSAGETYVGMMRENVLTIVEGLSRQP